MKEQERSALSLRSLLMVEHKEQSRPLASIVHSVEAAETLTISKSLYKSASLTAAGIGPGVQNKT